MFDRTDPDRRRFLQVAGFAGAGMTLTAAAPGRPGVTGGAELGPIRR
jgi:hypothetical protein